MEFDARNAFNQYLCLHECDNAVQNPNWLLRLLIEEVEGCEVSEQSKRKYTRAALKNMTISILMMAFFTIFWANFMLMSFATNILAIIGFALLAIYSAWLAFMGVKLKRAVAALPDEPKQELDARAEKRWNLIFIIQGIAIGASCALLGAFSLYNYIIPVIVLIIGLHYFPLGLLYHTPIHFIVGVPVVLLSTFATIFFPPSDFSSAAGGFSSLAAACSTTVLGAYMMASVTSAMVKK
ncbi:MAG: hypothetical protein LBU32_18595 [Clostridiales bacterium]|jgi:uncharacterized membrane protein|nr:hypothetical protein [Clostridiales bacterium]